MRSTLLVLIIAYVTALCAAAPIDGERLSTAERGWRKYSRKPVVGEVTVSGKGGYSKASQSTEVGVTVSQKGRRSRSTMTVYSPNEPTNDKLTVSFTRGHGSRPSGYSSRSKWY